MEKQIELDFRTVTQKDWFKENDNVRDAYFASQTIGDWIKRYDDDITDELSSMTIKELRDRLDADKCTGKHENYWNLFGDIDTEVRVWMIYLAYYTI